MSIKQILSEIKKARGKVNLNLEKANPNTINAQKGRARSNELRLPYLERDYKAALAKHLAVFIVTGSGAEEFAKVASDLTGQKALDAESIYLDLLERMPKESHNGRTSPKVAVDIMSKHFFDIGHDLEIASMPIPRLSSSRSFAIKSKEDLYDLIKRVVSESVGHSISAAYVLKQASALALENEFDGDLFPVIVKLNDDSIADKVLAGYREIIPNTNLLTAGELKSTINSAVISTTAEVSKENVIAALKNLKQLISMSGRTVSTKSSSQEQSGAQEEETQNEENGNSQTEEETQQ